MRSILLFSLLFLVFSCKKKVHKVHPELVGGWHHIEYPNKNHYVLRIGERSHGTASLYDSLNKELTFNGENPRKWYFNAKKNRLSCGLWGSPKFIVNQFPSIADTEIIDNYDTIPVGATYCIINNSYYIKY